MLFRSPHSQKGVTEGGPKLDVEAIRETYNPVHMVVDHYENFEQNFEERAKQFTNFFHVPKNQISMWYKVGRGMTMIEDYMMFSGVTYDLIIRLRPDLVFNEPLPDFDMNKFYTLGYRNHMGQGTSDMIQVGNQLQMILFSKAACYLTHIYSKTNLLCPHVLSSQWIQDMGLPWQEFHINKTLQHTPKGEYVEMDK